MMTDRDLLDRMTETATWAATAPVDPAADLARGRRRLRYRRLGVAATTCLAVAAGTVGVVSLADRPESPAASATVQPSKPPCKHEPAGCISYLQDPPRSADHRRVGARLSDWFARHVDPDRQYLKAPYAVAYGRDTEAVAAMEWRQGAGRGHAVLSLHPAGFYDIEPGWPSTRCHLTERPDSTEPPYDCRWSTVDGRRVLIGTANVRGVHSYFVSHVRADGMLVVAAVEGDWAGALWQKLRPPVYPPVSDPEVTIDDLVAVVTDPALTLG